MTSLKGAPRLFAATVIAALWAFVGDAQANGFGLTLQSPSAAATAGAGAPAAVHDSSTVFYNPAGMPFLPGGEAMAAAGVIFPSGRFTNAGSRDPAGNPLRGGTEVHSDPFILPTLFAAYPVSPDVWLGLSIAQPFGQGTEYDDGWVGRYHSIKAHMMTADISPNVAWRVAQWLSVGGGLDFQYARVKQTSAIDFGAVCIASLGPAPCAGLGLTPQAADGRLRVTTDDWGFGFNLGAMLQPADGTRLGIAYRSRIIQNLRGDADFTVPAAAAPLTSTGAFRDTSASAALNMPESIALGLRQELDRQWALLAAVKWTRWSRIDTVAIAFDNPAQPTIVQTRDWHDTYRFAVGFDYAWSETLTLSSGVAYEQGSVSTAFRTADLPDSDRVVLGLGARMRVGDALSFGLSYTYTHDRDASVDQLSQQGARLIGTFENHSHGVGAQLTAHF